MVNKHQIEQRLTRANPVSRPERLHEDPSEAQALLALIMERRDAMTITEQPTPVRTPAGPRWRPAIVAAAAGVLVLIVIGVAASIGFTGGGTGPADQATSVPVVESTLPPVTETTPPSATTVPAQTTVPEVPSASLLGGTWTHRALDAGVYPWGVIETDLGFFGRVSQDEIWRSTDGTAWSRVLTLPRGDVIEDPSRQPSEPQAYTIESYVRALVEYDGAVYAFAGIMEDAYTAAMTRRLVAYRSTDGIDWEETTFAHDAGLDTAVAGENELLVILGDAADSGTALMRSEDGEAWTRHETGFELESWALAHVNGKYLAVTRAAASEESFVGPMVRSADGITWEEIPGSELPSNALPRGLVQYEDVLYMGGHVFDEDGWQHGMIFYSVDGHVWQQAQLPELPNLRFVTQLIPSPHGLLALGWSGWAEDPAEPDRIVPLTTVDGSTFVEIPGTRDLFVEGPENTTGYSTEESIILHGIEYPRDETGHATEGPPVFHQWIWTPNS